MFIYEYWNYWTWEVELFVLGYFGDELLELDLLEELLRTPDTVDDGGE